MLMADIRGVLRPCGCTVDLQKGGFDRLGPFLAKERGRFPEAPVLHAGPLFYPDTEATEDRRAQRDRQAETVADLAATVGLDVAGATALDLVASRGHLSDLAVRSRVRFTAANLVAPDAPPTSRFEVRRIGGLRVGIFALAGELPEATTLGGTVSDPVAAAGVVVSELARAADVVVLLSDLGLRETKRLVRRVPGIHFAVVGGSGDHPSVSEEAELVGETRVMQFHREGRFVGRLTLRMRGGQTRFVDASAASEAEVQEVDARIAELQARLEAWGQTAEATERQLRSARHHLAVLRDERERLVARRVEVPESQSRFSFTLTPLDWDLPQDAGIVAIMDAFDAELARINVAAAQPLPEPVPGEAYYVGAEACFDCHEGPRVFWQADRHAKAWDTLVEDGKTFDAECVSCHVTGYGRAGGSVVGRTAGREDVQCEACHGPGSQHVRDEQRASILGHPTASTCIPCHNKHHSPGFDFDTYKPRLMVPGHGKPLADAASPAP